MRVNWKNMCRNYKFSELPIGSTFILDNSCHKTMKDYKILYHIFIKTGEKAYECLLAPGSKTMDPLSPLPVTKVDLEINISVEQISIQTTN